MNRSNSLRRFVVLALLLAVAVVGLPSPGFGAPNAPTLLAPSPGANVTSNPILSWSSVAKADRYRLQISAGSGFGTLIYNRDTYNTKATPPDELPLGTLFWRVAAIEGSTVGPFASSDFVKGQMLAPQPTYPDDDAVLTFPDEPLRFAWNPVPGAKSYRLEIDDATDFIGAAAYTTENLSYTVTEPQPVGQPFYWRVQAISSNANVNSEWSATRTYSSEWPGVPQLLSPTNTTATPIQDVNFVWQPVPGASKYQLQVSPNGDWANNTSIDVTVMGTRYSPPTSLNNGSFFWRVRALDARASAANAGGWSQEWEFSRGWPHRPTLLTPSNGDIVVKEPHFAWTPVKHASHYELQISTDVDFSPSTYWCAFTNRTTFSPYAREVGTGEPSNTCTQPHLPDMNNPSLQPGTTYYWRVRAIDTPVLGTQSIINGLWSSTSSEEAFSFVYRPDLPVVASPADGASVQTPVLRWNPVPGFGKYKVTVHKANGQQVITADTYATSYTPTSALNPADGPFSWHVETIDFHGKIGLQRHVSQWRTFSLEPHSAFFEAPNPTGPPTGSSSLDMPSLTWQPVTNAAYYKVRFGVLGSGVINGTPLSGNIQLRHPAFTYMGVNPAAQHGQKLAPGNYLWYVEAYNSSNVKLPDGTTRTFSISQLGQVSKAGPCSPGPCQVLDTPELSWNHVPHADNYLVYVALDPNFTNIYRRYRTKHAKLAPRESFLDNQAGQSYYWYVRPCHALRCGPLDESVYPQAASFHKRAKPIELISPASGNDISNLTTFAWKDFLETNQSGGGRADQEAKQYRIQVSTVADFQSLVDEKIVDQMTFTPFDKTYPEGPLYWRVQAIDGSNNSLTHSEPRLVNKKSPKPALLHPAPGATVSGLPYFSWSPQNYAARYEIEVFKNGDLNFSSSNRVANGSTKMAAWSPTAALGTGPYAWRVRRIDAGNRPGPWSDGRLFNLSATAPTLLSPANGVAATFNDVVFQWTGAPRAVKYQFELSTSPSFSTLVQTQKTVMTSWAPTAKLAAGTYYWRVKALDSRDNPGPPSEVRSLVISGGSTSVATTITLKVTKKPTRLRATGGVKPPRAGRQVVVKLLKKRGGKYVRIATRKPSLSASSTYATSFRRPGQGACRIVARYPGDPGFLASKVTRSFRC